MQEAVCTSPGKPLVIYYSRLGTTRTVAREMAQNLKCEIEEIISNENRHGLWTVNCVFDQLLDWDDDVVPLYHDVTAYNPVIIAGPHMDTPLCDPAAHHFEITGPAGKRRVCAGNQSGKLFGEG